MGAARTGRHLHSEQDVRDLLEGAGLRATTQRLVLARHLFGGGNRHVTAAELHQAVTQSGGRVSIATVYNTLGQFVSAGLLHEVTVDNECTYYDTNIVPHCHIYDEDMRTLTDAPLPEVSLPDDLQPGSEVVSVEVLFRVRRRRV